MAISDFLLPARVLVDVQATDKGRLLKDLSNHAAAALGLRSGVIAAELLKREELGSTGIGGGVAIPHAGIDGIDRPHGLVVRLQRPIDFNAVDGMPVDLVFVLLTPASGAGSHLNALAAIARRLSDSTVVEGIRTAPTAAALHQLMTA